MMPVHFKTCLLVDDNYIDNFVTRRILESGNFADEIIVIQSPFEALSALEDGSIKPDVIFLDIRMPMMTGFEFLQKYEDLDLENSVKIFMLSSSLDPTDMDNSHNSKYVTQFVHKPLTHEALEELT